MDLSWMLQTEHRLTNTETLLVPITKKLEYIK